MNSPVLVSICYLHKFVDSVVVEPGPDAHEKVLQLYLGECSVLVAIAAVKGVTQLLYLGLRQAFFIIFLLLFKSLLLQEPQVLSLSQAEVVM